MRKRIPVMLGCLLWAVLIWAQDQKPGDGANTMPGMNMPGMDKESSAHVMHSMEGRHMDMGPHMKMTSLRAPKPGDAERAAQVAKTAREVAEKYTDYKTALADGFKIFLPNVPQKMYHFTNYSYGFEAIFHFDPEHPTSLLYEKQGDGYKLIGVMYTAAKNANESELDERVPLSIAQWHAHVNLCLPPADRRKEILGPHPQFGLNGSITSKEACSVAGGTFRPQVFGWMVHVYPFEKKAENVWSVERQAHGHMD
jgi:hypothetical protein